jgi:hypothetical protein
MGRRNLVRWRGGVARQTPKPRAGGGRWTAAPWRPELLGDVETAGFEGQARRDRGNGGGGAQCGEANAEFVWPREGQNAKCKPFC